MIVFSAQRHSGPRGHTLARNCEIGWNDGSLFRLRQAGVLWPVWPEYGSYLVYEHKHAHRPTKRSAGNWTSDDFNNFNTWHRSAFAKSVEIISAFLCHVDISQKKRNSKQQSANRRPSQRLILGPVECKWFPSLCPWADRWTCALLAAATSPSGLCVSELVEGFALWKA